MTKNTKLSHGFEKTNTAEDNATEKSRFTPPDSSYFTQKSINVPVAGGGNIPMVIGFSTNSELNSVIKVTPDAFERVMGDRGDFGGDFGATDSLVLNDYRFSKQAEDGAMIMPSILPPISVQRGEYEGEQKKIGDNNDTIKLYGRSELFFLKNNGAEFYPLVVSGSPEDALKMSKVFECSEPPILAKDLMVEGDDIRSALSSPESDVAFSFPINEAASLAYSRGVLHYLFAMADHESNMDDIAQQREESDPHMKDYIDHQEKQFIDKFQQSSEMYGAFPRAHMMINILAAAGVETVELHKYYESMHTAADLSLQVALVQDGLDLTKIDDPLDMVSRYERLIAINPQDSWSDIGLPVVMNDKQDDWRIDFRQSLASLISQTPAANALAYSELSPEQIVTYEADVSEAVPVLVNTLDVK